MSWPAACAYGPSWPQPVMRPYTSFGLRARQASGPMPSRSATPGRKPSMSASACSTSFITVSTPSAFFRSTPMERRPRFRISRFGRSKLPVTAWARSTRTTSAPMSASIIAANGPGPIPAISTTFTPDNGPDTSALPDPTMDRGRYAPPCRTVRLLERELETGAGPGHRDELAGAGAGRERGLQVLAAEADVGDEDVGDRHVLHPGDAVAVGVGRDHGEATVDERADH